MYVRICDIKYVRRVFLGDIRGLRSKRVISDKYWQVRFDDLFARCVGKSQYFPGGVFVWKIVGDGSISLLQVLQQSCRI